MRRAGFPAALLILTAGPLAAAECRLALVLAMDVSSSVDDTEDSLQRNGLASALLSPRVEAAVFASPVPVAIAVFEWSGRYNQELLVDWSFLNNRSDLFRVAETIARSERSHNDFPTAMGYALGYAAGLLDRGPRCENKVVDMAGDGENNEGFPPAAAYAEFPFDGVTVNGLVVQAPDYQAEIDLIDYYTNNVLHGPGAFLEVAQSFSDYERAMIRKLEREMRPATVGALQGAGTAAPG